MIIVKKRAHCSKVDFMSANEEIHVNVDENYMELTLEDNSIILLDVATFFSMVRNNSIHIDVIKLYMIGSDDVAGVQYNGEDIYEVEDYFRQGTHFYRFLI